MANFGDLAQLLLALAGLVTSIGGAAAAIITSIRGGRKDRAIAQQAQNRPIENGDGNGFDAQDVAALVQFIEQNKVQLKKKKDPEKGESEGEPENHG